MKIICSTSRTGCCCDNAVAERFFWSLKHEWTKFDQNANLEDVKICVFKYIETFYNSERIHQTLEYLPPVAFEKQYHGALGILTKTGVKSCWANTLYNRALPEGARQASQCLYSVLSSGCQISSKEV